MRITARLLKRPPQWQQPPFLLTRAEADRLSENGPHECEDRNDKAEFGRALIEFIRRKEWGASRFLQAGKQAFQFRDKKEAEVGASASLIYFLIAGDCYGLLTRKKCFGSVMLFV